MLFSAIVVTLLGVIASATAGSLFARQSPYPACANSCLTSVDFGGCIPSDVRCLCLNNAFVANTTKCFYTSCTGADLQTALGTAREICAKVGVTLTSTPASTASATGSSASPSTGNLAKSGASSISASYGSTLGLGAAALAALAALCI